jgi:hypothetical protein
MDVGLLGSWGVFDIIGQFDTLVVVALIAVLGDLAVGLRIEVLWFYCRDVAYIAWDVGIDGAALIILLLGGLVGRRVAHVADYRRFFGLYVQHSSGG